MQCASCGVTQEALDKQAGDYDITELEVCNSLGNAIGSLKLCPWCLMSLNEYFVQKYYDRLRPDSHTPTFNLIIEERNRQILEWGGAPHDDSLHISEWLRILLKHLGRCADDIEEYHGRKSIFHLDAFRDRMVVVAAVAVACIESVSRRLDGRLDDG